MAKNISVVITDDIDGSLDAETLTLGFDGTRYEIDLAEKNRLKLEKALAPYIQHGRRVVRSRRKAVNGRPHEVRVERAAIRTWAREQGLKISERGRISAEIISQYEAAQSK